MILEQIYTGCLAQGAYYLESDGEAAVIDPLREPGPYLERANKTGAKIKYIFETHFHADFVSGHLDLAKESGATIVYGPEAETQYAKYEAKDGEIFHVGKVSIKVLHTPGHTPESTSFLLHNEDGKPYALFTGDTLFIGDVGRPDLAQKSTGLTKEDLAGWLYDSLRKKVMTLPDDVIIYPAHGAGSACGKNMSSETWSTLGQQKKTNYALREDMTKEEFIQEVTHGLQPPPGYFSENARLNKEGYTSISEVLNKGVRALSVSEFERIANASEALMLDVRSKVDFVKGFIPNSIFIGLDGSFAPWVGALIKSLDQPILIISPKGREEEAVTRLARVGYDNTLGYLEGGFEAWVEAGKEIDRIHTINSEDFAARYQRNPDLTVIDVRKPGEFSAEHLKQAKSVPLSVLSNSMHEFEDKAGEFYLHCRSGYRSTIASSILHSRGYRSLINIQDKFSKLSDDDRFEKVQGSCSSSIA